MGAMEYGIAFAIAGKVASAFENSFQKAGGAIDKLSEQLEKLNSDAERGDGLVKARKAVAESAREFIKAREKVAELGRVLHSTKKPTAEMIESFNRARVAVRKAKVGLEEQRATLRKLDTEAGTTGQSLKELTDRQKALKEATDKTRAAQEKFRKVNDALGKAKAGVNDGVIGIGATIAGVRSVAEAPVRQAMSFEDQRAELGKYTDQADKVFAGIQERMLKYAVSGEDMTAMASAAFQAGIAKDYEESLKILDKQNQAVVAFGLTGEQVGDAWADLQSKLHMTIDQTAELFDITNQYSNTVGVKAADMFDIMQRGGGALAGMTKLNYKQIGALSASFRKASTSSEVASTSMLSFTNALTAGSTASKSQKDGFDKIGVSAEKLAKMMTKSPEAAERAITDVLKRISKLSQDEQGAVVGQIFGNDAGVKGAVINLVNGIDMVKENFETIKDPAKYADSMFKEFQARADTTSNSLQIMENSIKLITGGIGTALLPTVRKGAEAFVSASKGIIKWVNENQGFIQKLSKFAVYVVGFSVAILGLKIVIAGLSALTLGVYQTFLGIQKALIVMRNNTLLATAATKAQSVAIGAWRVVVTFATSTITLMRTAMLSLSAVIKANPVGAVITAFSLFAVAGVALYENWDALKAKATEVWGAFSSKFPALASIAKTAFSDVSGVVQTVKSVFSELIDFVTNVFMGQWSAAWESVKGIFSSTFMSMGALAKTPINGVIGMVNGAISAMNGINVKIPDWVPGVGGQTFGVNLPQIPQLADGGIAMSSTLANIGEGGEPEAVIPLSKLPSLLGTAGGGIGGGISVNFAPVINVSGGSGDAYEGVKRGLDEGRRQFEKDLRRLMADQQRLSFA